MPRYLAIDWDQQQLHVVAADIRGGTVAFRRAAVWHEEQSPNAGDAEALGRLLRQRLKEAGIGLAPVLACVGRDRVILKDVRYPAVPEAEEPAIVRFQAVKELTEPPDEIVLDYAPLGNGGPERRALALAIRREALATWQKLCLTAGLKLAGLTPRPFGLLAAAAGVPTAEPTALVASGERWAEFCVVRNGQLLFARTLTPGPGLVAEARRNLAVFSGQAAGQRVASVWIAGTTDGALHQRLGEALDVPVNAFDPFGGAAGEALPVGERGSFAAAAGLLLAKAQPKGLPVNFVHPRQPVVPRQLHIGRVAAAVTAAIILLGGTAAYCRGLYLEQAGEKIALESALDDAEQDLVRARESGKRVRALDSWESPVWLDVIYDLSALIPDTDALRITQLTAEPLARTATSRYAARLGIKGTLRDGRAPLDALMVALKRDPSYSPLAPKVNGAQFELVVNVERRPPGEYKLKLAGGPAR